MRVCKCSSVTIDIELSPMQTVYEAKVAIAESTKHDVAEIKLIYKGGLLQNDMKLCSYGFCEGLKLPLGITEQSILHMVISKIRDFALQPVQTDDDNCQFASEISTIPSEGSADNTECGNSIFDSVLKHVLGNEPIPFGKENTTKTLEELHYAFNSYPNIIKIAVETPLIQDILSDINVTRSLVLTNHMIVELMELNPQFSQFVMDDDNIREVTRILSDPHSYDDFIATKQTILRLVESRIGCHLQFTDEYVFLLLEINNRQNELVRLARRFRTKALYFLVFTYYHVYN